MKVVKILALTAAAIVALLIVAAVVVAYLIDPNDYKDSVTRYVEERTGRTLGLDGDIELSFFPWLALETGGVTLGNRPDFGDEPFATIDSLSARVRVWPLLRREIEIGTVVLDGVVLNLGTDEAGNANWDDLVGRSGTPDDQPESPAAEPAGGIEALAIEGIEIRNARLLWRENGNEIRYIVSDIELSTGTISLDDPVEFETSFTLLDTASQLTLTVALEGVGELTAEPVRLRDLKAQVALGDTRQAERAVGELMLASVTMTPEGLIEAGTAAASGRVMRPPVGPDSLDVEVGWSGLRYDPAAQTATATGLVTVVNGIEASWQAEATGLADAPRVAGRLVLASVAARTLLEVGGLHLPQEIRGTELGNVAGNASFSAELDTGAVTVDTLDVRLLGLAVTGTAALDESGGLRGKLTVPAFAPNDGLRALASAYVPESVDLTAVESLAFDGNFDRATNGTTRLSNLTVGIGGATLTGSVAIEPGAGGTRYSGTVATSPIPPRLVTALVGDLTEQLGAREIGRISVESAFAYDSATDRATLSNLALAAFGLEASGNVEIYNVASAPVVSGRAALAPFAPREFLTRFGQPVPETSDPEALRQAQVSGGFTIDAEHAEFRELVVVLDQSRFTGAFDVENFADPTYHFDLTGDRVDVDRYLPPPADEVEEGERAAGDIELDSDALALLRLAGTARVGDLKLANLRFQQVTTDLDIGNGFAVLDSARARLYGGEFAGRFEVDTRGEQPTLQLVGQATNLALEPLLVALAGESSVTGTGSFDLDLKGTGPTVTDNLNSATGKMSFALRDGVIDGFNLEHTLCQVFNRAQQLPSPAAAPANTRYVLIRAAADVSDGIATSRELVAQSTSLEITGSGRLMLVDARVDYDMRAKLARAISISGCDSMDRQINGSFPFTIKGPISKPTILPDFGEYLRDRLRDEIEDRVRDRILRSIL